MLNSNFQSSCISLPGSLGLQVCAITHRLETDFWVAPVTWSLATFMQISMGHFIQLPVNALGPFLRMSPQAAIVMRSLESSQLAGYLCSNGWPSELRSSPHQRSVWSVPMCKSCLWVTYSLLFVIACSLSIFLIFCQVSVAHEFSCIFLSPVFLSNFPYLWIKFKERSEDPGMFYIRE